MGPSDGRFLRRGPKLEVLPLLSKYWNLPERFCCTVTEVIVYNYTIGYEVYIRHVQLEVASARSVNLGWAPWTRDRVVYERTATLHSVYKDRLTWIIIISSIIMIIIIIIVTLRVSDIISMNLWFSVCRQRQRLWRLQHQFKMNQRKWETDIWIYGDLH